MVSNSVMIAMYTLFIIIAAFPIMTAILLKMRKKVRFAPFLLGLVTYFTFAVICVSVLNVLFLSDKRPTSFFIKNNVIPYSIYFAIVTGMLEELGIMVAFKKILVSRDEKSTAFMYALGHAGLDAVLIAGPALLVYINCGATINELGIEGFREKFADARNINPDEIIDILQKLGISDILYMGFERIMYFAMHIFLSFMIFYSVKRRTIAYFWFAVVLRALCTIPGSVKKFYPDNTGLNVVLVGFTLVFIGFAGYIAYRLYGNYDTEEILLPKNLFARKSTYKNV